MKNIKLGEYYRLKGNTFAWAKPIEIIPPKTGINKERYPIAKCEWTTSKDSLVGLIKYFKVSDLEEQKK
jgi:hypothetical protein